MHATTLTRKLMSKARTVAILGVLATFALAVPAEAQLYCTATRVLETKQWAVYRIIGATLELSSGEHVTWIFCDLNDATAPMKEADCYNVLNTMTVAVGLGSPVQLTFSSGVPKDTTASPLVPATTCAEIAQWQRLEGWLSMVNLLAN